MSDPSISLRVWAALTGGRPARIARRAQGNGEPTQRSLGLVAGWVSGGESVAERKTVTKSTMIGEGGIALISVRCLEMGFIFPPRRVDHGIDGTSTSSTRGRGRC